ncbi:MAG: succinylglutamate desuccinylase/aspartoacylase family protein [Dehalococcoidia bacterium]
MRRLSRAQALRSLGTGALGIAGATLFGCSADTLSSMATTMGGAASTSEEPSRLEDAPEVAAPAPVGPPPPLEAGRETRPMLPGTPWETPLVLAHSGLAGPRVLVLGGVHGNEPGAWQAAEAVATWEPHAGSLLVIPRANRLATLAFERTFPELGDLNRLYPGAQDAPLPMARMAAAILGVVRDFEVDLVLDMHESWGFYHERGSNSGTAFIGQTVTKGEGPLPEGFVRDIVTTVNATITPREEFTFRDRLPQPPPGAISPSAVGGVQPGGRSSSSLAIGQHAPGATAILVEMGQMDQAEYRRRDLHLLLARELLTRHGVL